MEENDHVRRLLQRKAPRRRFCEVMLLAGGSAAAFSCGISPALNEQVFPKPVKRLYEVYGIHDTPNGGGSIKKDLFRTDLQVLRPKGVTFINGSEDLLRIVRTANLSVVMRTVAPKKNRFDAEFVEKEVSKTFSCIEGGDPIFQVTGNEPNLLHETGGVPVSPKEHIEKFFLPAAEIVSRIAKRYGKRARILTTPLARNAPEINGLNEEAYFSEMLNCLRPYVNKLDCELVLGLHPYNLELNENPLDYIEKRYFKALSLLNIELPIYATEAGIYQTTETGFDDDVVAAETSRILKMEIPSHLPIIGFDLWVLANDVQRPKEDHGKFKDYEKAALRRLTGVTPTYRAIAGFV